MGGGVSPCVMDHSIVVMRVNTHKRKNRNQNDPGLYRTVINSKRLYYSM